MNDMKKWEMPQVKIDKFVANEFVAACTPITPFSGEGAKRWLDWNYNGLYSPRERLYAGNGSDYHITTSGEGELTRGYYQNVNLYKLKKGSNDPNFGEDAVSYEGRHGDDISWVEWELAGTYDVYVYNSQHIRLYTKDSFPDGDDPITKPFS